MRLAPWQRTAIRWVIAPLGILLALGAAFYFTVIDTSYARTEYYPDTALGTSAGSLGLDEVPGRVTLAVIRGEGESLGFTDTGWHEEALVEFSSPSTGDRIELAAPGVRVGYRKLQPLGFPWEIGDRGVRGYILVLDAGSRRLKVEYEIVIDAYSDRLIPEARHRKVSFRGTATFRSKHRPEGRWAGGVWPKS